MAIKSGRHSAPQLLLLVLSITIWGSFANFGSWKESPSSFRRRGDAIGNNDNNNRKNPFALGIERAISQTIVPVVSTKATTRKTQQCGNSNNYDDGSRETRNAFIDRKEEATEIQYTMKPHLKHTSSSSSERETHSVIQAKTIAAAPRPLLFWESMVSGAVSRSIAQTVMHPANTMKTIMQASRGPSRPGLFDLMKPTMFHRLTYGAGANFVLSLPHGAFNFAVLESIRERMSTVVDSVPVLERNKERIGPGLDFISSSIATICCSVVSTPQMMITDVSFVVCWFFFVPIFLFGSCIHWFCRLPRGVSIGILHRLLGYL